MTRSQSPAVGERDVTRQRRFGPTLAAFLFGLPAAAGILATIHFGPLHDTIARRYVSHPVECVEVGLFCCAVGALLSKLLAQFIEKAALRRNLLPAWNGKAVAVAEAAGLQTELAKQPGWVRSSFIGNRCAAVLDFLISRGSAVELDDQLRALADNDSINLDASYSLTRFISWAMPILGFLGTVLGITAAIANVSPDQLEKSLSTVTDGLALAFDATALALGLTMIVMFVSFIVERMEQQTLGAVDRSVERQLAHRFERTGALGGEIVEVLRQQGQTMLGTMEKLVQQQAAVWAKTMEETQRQRSDVEADFRRRFEAALENALEGTLEAHAKRLASFEKQAAGPATVLVERLGTLAKAADALGKQTEALGRLQEGEKHLLRLQGELQNNLAVLADAGSFQQAVHSLTAAIHLLTAHAVSGPTNRRPGAAA